MFFFPGSKNFIDFLQAESGQAVEKFCSPITAKTKRFQVFAARVTLKQAVKGKETRVKGKVVRDRMQEDREFLRSMKDNLGPLAGEVEEKDKQSQREKVRSEVGKTVEFLDARQEFWKQIG